MHASSEYTSRSPLRPPRSVRKIARKRTRPPQSVISPSAPTSEDSLNVEIFEVDSSKESLRTLHSVVDEEMDSSDRSFRTNNFVMDDEGEPSEEQN